jgi:transcriptional regulator with XRE-family HTH domain
MSEHAHDWIRKRRDGLGLSQEELARRARISRTYLSNLERGVSRNPSWAVLERLRAALGGAVSGNTILLRFRVALDASGNYAITNDFNQPMDRLAGLDHATSRVYAVEVELPRPEPEPVVELVRGWAVAQEGEAGWQKQAR